MSLDDLLKPAKWADEQILRQYTKIGKKFHLDSGRKRYLVGLGLWLTHAALCSATGYQLFGAAEQPIRISLNVLDFGYNLNGATGLIRDETASETKTIDPIKYLYQTFNSIERLPAFVAGVGLVGKYGIDLFNYVINGEPVDSNSYNCLGYGFGLLSLASSMYIKEIDPKLLNKAPFWKTAYNWAKEKVSSLTPQPLPQPAPLQSSTTLENYVRT